MKRIAPVVLVALGLGLGLGACRDTTDGGPFDLSRADLTGVVSDLSGVDAALPPLKFTTNVTVVVEPQDKGKAFTAAVQDAKKSIHMTMYIIEDDSLLTTLENQYAAGVDVKVILNQTFPDGESNQTAYNELSSKGVPVKWAPSRFQYTHEKAVTIDGSTAVIMTMNAASGSYTGNREYVGLDTDADDVAETEAIFEADWNNTVTNETGKLVTAPDNAGSRLVQLCDMAVTTIDMEAEEFSSASILSALGRAYTRGVTIRLLLSNETPTQAQSNAILELDAVKIPVRKLGTPDIHAKALVIDGEYAYIGSENFTDNSLENNRELGLLTSTQSEVDKIATQIDSDFNAGTPE